MTSALRTSLCAAAVLLFACGGGGLYGFAREYSPLSAERDHMEGSTEISYEEVRRDPVDFQSTTVAWFGVVTDLTIDESGAGTISMTYRTLAARNLCGDETSGSCRVTVSEREGGPFSATVQLRPEEQAGEDRLWRGSLVKIYGHPNGEFDEQGGPILVTDWHRHWPRGAYVTTGDRASMRR